MERAGAGAAGEGGGARRGVEQAPGREYVRASGEVQETRQRVSKVDANSLSVRLELQADYLAGVWAHHANKSRNVLEVGDVEEGLRAASAIGDDRLQKQSRGFAVPDSFTHGSSDQRVRWFRKGLESGDMTGGDTFGAEAL